MGSKKISLLGMTPDELKEVTQEAGLPSFASQQLSVWLYRKNITLIDQMTDISKKGREILAERYEIGLKPHTEVRTSSDGTKKYLFPAGNMKFIETAFIPEENRNTLCLSTQVGCKMACLFCMTGKQGFQGNLTAGEILNQVKSLPESDKISNIVYMGMGEPLDNPDEVLKSLMILTSEWGFAMSPRRITVSTIGIIPSLKRLISESEVNIALSLHSPFNEERKMIVPLEKVYPLHDIIKELKAAVLYGQRRISVEYIMLKGFNDTGKHVLGLIRLLNGLKCRINLIRFHPIPGTTFESTPDEEIEIFRNKLNEKGFITTIRKSRGKDINAACGLLSTKK